MTWWFIKRYAEEAGIQASGVKEIADKAKTDHRAREIFIKYGQNLGLFLGSRLKAFDAETLVIGGNISDAYPLLSGYLKNYSGTRVETSIQISELKEDAALIGSARMFEEDFWANVKPLLAKM